MLSSAFVVSSKLQYMSIISNLEMNKKPSLFIMTVSELNGAVCLHLKYMLNKATAPLLEHVSGVCLCACVQDMQWGPDIQNLPIKTSLEHFHIKLEKMDKQVYDEWLILLVLKNMQRDQCSISWTTDSSELVLFSEQNPHEPVRHINDWVWVTYWTYVLSSPIQKKKE